jgi:hypothetical protein
MLLFSVPLTIFIVMQSSACIFMCCFLDCSVKFVLQNALNWRAPICGSLLSFLYTFSFLDWNKIHVIVMVSHSRSGQSWKFEVILVEEKFIEI